MAGGRISVERDTGVLNCASHLLGRRECFHVISTSNGSFQRILGESEVSPLHFEGTVAGT